MATTRIFWREDEISTVALKFVELRMKDPLGETMDLMRKAQEALAENRRRDLLGLNNVKNIVAAVEEIWPKAILPPSPLIPEPVVVSTSTPPPPPPPPAPALQSIEKPSANGPAGEMVIEIRAEKSDLATTLAQCPTPMLLGYAMERILSLPKAAAVLAPFTSVRVEASAPLPVAPGVPPPAPVPETPLIKSDSVVGGADTRKHVVILGLLPDALSMAREKCVALGNVVATFVDSREARPVPSSVRCDYLLMTKDTVSKFQAEQIRRRLGSAGEKRVIHIDGTVAEAMKQLAMINSLQ